MIWTVNDIDDKDEDDDDDDDYTYDDEDQDDDDAMPTFRGHQKIIVIEQRRVFGTNWL